MIYNDNAGLDYLTSIRDGSFKLGLGIGCDLDEHLRYKKNDFNVFAGHANVGKTLGILYYFVCLAKKHGLKFVVFSSENDIGGIKDDLISLSIGKKIKSLKTIDFEYAHYWVNEHFKFFNADSFFYENKRLMNFRDILKETEELTFDALVIDPYNSLGKVETIKGNTHEYDYQVMSEFRMWCKKQNKALYLLAHGNTDALRKVHYRGTDFEGHPMPLVSADIEGGGKFVNRCDNFVVLHRMTQHPTEWMKTEWHITKIKNTKTGGKPTFKKNPVIFQANRDMLSFNCYIRADDYLQPSVNSVNPLAEITQVEEIQRTIKPNTEFENEINEVEPF